MRRSTCVAIWAGATSQFGKLDLDPVPFKLREILQSDGKRRWNSLAWPMVLKGAISNFSSGAAFHAAVRLEQFAKEGDTTLAMDAFKQLERDMGELTNALKDFVRGVPKA